MLKVLRGATVAVATALAAMAAAAPTQAAPVNYQITGCEISCDNGITLTGSMTLDLTLGPDWQIELSEFTDLRYSVNGGTIIAPAIRWATGESGPTNGTIDNLTFYAGTSVLPLLGDLAQSAMQGNPDGSLAGTFIYSRGGACTTATCDDVQASIYQSYFNVTMTPEVTTGEPAPVPAPPALGLILAGTGTLAGLAGWRRRRS